MSTFILELPLKTQPFQEDILNKRFNIARTIYNALLNVSQKRYKEMVKTKEYRALMERLRELSSKKQKGNPEYKAITKKLDEMRKRFGINEHAFQKDGVAMQHHFKKHIDSDTCQKIATRLWRAYEEVLFGKGEDISFKKFDGFNSLECKKDSAVSTYKNQNQRTKTTKQNRFRHEPEAIANVDIGPLDSKSQREPGQSHAHSCVCGSPSST